jgi:hypothetical protein
MAHKAGWGLLALGIALVHCGGISVTPIDSDNATQENGGSSATTSAGSAETGGCMADALEAGCGGEAGEKPLEPYARLRTACGQVNVNRRGNPVAVTFCIQ